MKKVVKAMDEFPLWLKVILALPILDIVWAVYRIIKGAAYGKVSLVIWGIVWIILGWAIFWIIDIISLIVYRDIKILA